jgi:hypothetical protein
MSFSQLMSQSEIHDFGIEVVSNYLKKEGFTILGINTKLGDRPQIVAVKGKDKLVVAVETDCYPNKGKLSEEDRKEMLSIAERDAALPYFASVGICNAQAKAEEEMSTPIKGNGFHVAYEGIVKID